MQQGLLSYFKRQGTSGEGSNLNKLLPKTPEKQLNGKSTVQNGSTSKATSVSTVSKSVNKKRMVNGNSQASQQPVKKKREAVFISSSDESDPEDPISILKIPAQKKGPSPLKSAEKVKGLVKPLVPVSPKKTPTKRERPSLNINISSPESSPPKQPIQPKKLTDIRPAAPPKRKSGPEIIRVSAAAPAKRAKKLDIQEYSDSSPERPKKAQKIQKGKAAPSKTVSNGKKAEKEPSNLLAKKPSVNCRARSSSNEKTDDVMKVSYLGIEKTAKEITVNGKLLQNLAKAHEEIKTPSIRESPNKTISNGTASPASSTRSRSASKESLEVILVEKTPEKRTSIVAASSDQDEISIVHTSRITKSNSIMTAISSKRSPKKTTKESSVMRKSSPPKFTSTASAPHSLPWVDKHRPTSTKQIIGQQGDKSCLKKLFSWLRDWPKWHLNAGEKQKRVSKGVGNDGSTFKAVLLSGPPGIGKTTTAELVCKELGLDYVALNASDARNKRCLEQTISECLSSHTITEYASGAKNQTNKGQVKNVLIMDEVDGMSGNEDRAGIAELIALIKNTQIPIICICNDRHNQKIRSLANHCYDLRFHRPQEQQILGTIMSILYKEKVKLPSDAVKQIIETAGHDVRQILNHLNFLAVTGKPLDLDDAKRAAKSSGKDETLNVFESIRKLFSAKESRQMSITDKTELFFGDYDLVPLFVEENYLNVTPDQAKSKVEHLDLLSRTADLLAWGDTVDRQIRNDQNWSLLSQKAMLSTVIPCELMKGRMNGQIAFPTWFGRYSKQNRLQRLMQQLQFHSSRTASASVSSTVLDYAPAFRQRTTQPLLKPNGAVDGVDTVLKTMDTYGMTLEDRNAILEITQWPGAKDPAADASSRVKAALTRAYNKHNHKLPYAVAEVAKKKRGKKDADNDDEEMEDTLDEEIVEEDIPDI